MEARMRARGLDVISLGPGEGGKEISVLQHLLALERTSSHRFAWLTFAPVDVSVPLLLSCATGARRAVAEAGGGARATVTPYCADFEEGRLAFAQRLPTTLASSDQGLRLVLMLGNVFGNVREEESFVRQKLWSLARPGDLVWLEVGLRPKSVADDPLFRLTTAPREETAAEAARRLLLEGPYRRWEAALGRPQSSLEMRVWLREDDESSRIPGSINFCHDLVIKDERRVCTMLYSRRYNLESLIVWLERMQLRLERSMIVEDSKHRPRVAHLLLRRT